MESTKLGLQAALEAIQRQLAEGSAATDKRVSPEFTPAQCNTMRQAVMYYGEMLKSELDSLAEVTRTEGLTEEYIQAGRHVVVQLALLDQISVIFNKTILDAGYFEGADKDEAQREVAEYAKQTKTGE